MQAKNEFEELQDRVERECDAQREMPPIRQIVLGTWVLEAHLPDGYHWFGGIFYEPNAAARGRMIPMNLWSPHLEDAEGFTTEMSAQKACATMVDEVACYVVPVESAIKTRDENPFVPQVVSTPIDQLDEFGYPKQ